MADKTDDTTNNQDGVPNQNDDLAVHKEDERTELEILQKEIEQLQTDQEGLTNQLKRAVADYQNLEKRISEGRSELASWTTSSLIQKILPVLDNLEKALAGVSEEEKKSGWLKGVEMSVKQLQQVLKDEGVDQIEADGQFDPTLHEAVDTKEGEDNTVLEITRKGYTLNGKVLRPAQVIVGKKN